MNSDLYCDGSFHIERTVTAVGKRLMNGHYPLTFTCGHAQEEDPDLKTWEIGEKANCDTCKAEWERMYAAFRKRIIRELVRLGTAE